MIKLNKLLDEKNTTLLIILFAALALFLPHLISLAQGNTGLFGAESYHQKILAESIIEKGASSETPSPTPYAFLLAFTTKLSNSDFASKFLPFFLGILSALFLNLLLKNLSLSKKERLIALFITILSPAFLSQFLISSPMALLLPLNLLAFCFLTSRSKTLHYLSIPLFITFPLFGILPAVINLLFLLFSYFTLKKKRRVILISVVSLALSVLLAVILQLTHRGFLSEIALSGQSLIPNLISELGALNGFPIFALLLSFLSLYSYWKEKSIPKSMSIYIPFLRMKSGYVSN